MTEYISKGNGIVPVDSLQVGDHVKLQSVHHSMRQVLKQQVENRALICDKTRWALNVKFPNVDQQFWVRFRYFELVKKVEE